MLQDKLKNYKLILASNSPRRKQFLEDLGFKFEVQTKPVEEIYPEGLQKEEITNFLATLKAEPFSGMLKFDEILITSDTIVWHDNKALGKPLDKDHSLEMLTSLSGKTHEVISSVCITTDKLQLLDYVITEVTFKNLTTEEINYYIENYKPFDKAGSYGIQEWIGHIGITSIKGSYNNVVGLPTFLLYELLKKAV